MWYESAAVEWSTVAVTIGACVTQDLASYVGGTPAKKRVPKA